MHKAAGVGAFGTEPRGLERAEAIVRQNEDCGSDAWEAALDREARGRARPGVSDAGVAVRTGSVRGQNRVSAGQRGLRAWRGAHGTAGVCV